MSQDGRIVDAIVGQRTVLDELEEWGSKPTRPKAEIQAELNQYLGQINHHRKTANQYLAKGNKNMSWSHNLQADRLIPRAKRLQKDLAKFKEAEFVEAYVDLNEAALERIFVEGFDEFVERGGATAAEYRARAASYPDHDGGIGSSKREDIGNGKGRKYPPGFQHIRNALIRSGKSVAVASMIAWASLRRWARGGGNVKKSTRAKAAKVLSQLNAGRAGGAAKRGAKMAAREAAFAAAEDVLAEAGRHRLTFYSNRSTPVVTPVGAKRKPAKANYGHVTHSRLSTPEEDRRMKGGRWLRVDEKGRGPSDRAYRGHGSRRLGPPAR